MIGVGEGEALFEALRVGDICEVKMIVMAEVEGVGAELRHPNLDTVVKILTLQQLLQCKTQLTEPTTRILVQHQYVPQCWMLFARKQHRAPSGGIGGAAKTGTGARGGVSGKERQQRPPCPKVQEACPVPEKVRGQEDEEALRVRQMRVCAAIFFRLCLLQCSSRMQN